MSAAHAGSISGFSVDHEVEKLKIAASKHGEEEFGNFGRCRQAGRRLAIRCEPGVLPSAYSIWRFGGNKEKNFHCSQGAGL